MTDDDRKRDEERKKKKEEERRKSILRSREHQSQELVHSRKYRSLHDKHRERRKKDCMLHMPFIIAFQGDPAMPFYCNDVRDCDGTPIYELIKGERNLARLKRYMAHHVTSIYAKVLIHKAGPDEDIEKAKALFWYYIYLRKPT